VTLSLRASLLICGLGSVLGLSAAARADVPQAQVAPATAAARQGGPDAQGLARRIERLLPAMLSSLAAARRHGEPSLVRCFDRAVSGLHSLSKQVTYHAERGARAREASERDRHQRALLYLAQRVDELAHSGETCFTDGVLLPPGQTQVEVVIAP
jgi:hypothetical protein